MKFYYNIDNWIDRNANKLVWLFIALYAVILGVISCLKFYSFGYYDWDFASDIIIFWNSLHGHLLYYPFLEQNIFGAHLYLIIFLILPIYAFFQHPLTLLFLQSIFLGLAAYPLYLFAKTQVPKKAALVIATAYLLYPSIGFINLFETHFEIYEIFFLFFALYFFEKENFKSFMLFLVLALICKENVSFVVFMFGLYSFLRKRPVKWVIIPMLLGATWFMLALKLIIPYFAKEAKLYQEGFIFSVYYKHLGATMGEMARTMIAHPIAVTRFALSPRKIIYICQLFSPVGFISFFSPGPLIITIPIFMQNLLSLVPTHAQIQYQYVGLFIPFIFASVVFAFKRFLANMQARRYVILIFVFFISSALLSGFLLKIPQLYFTSYCKAFKLDEQAKAKMYLVDMIPKGAPVIATFKFLPHLADRHDLYSFHFVSTGFKMYTRAKYVPPDNLEYALIGFDDPLMVGSFFPPEAPSNIRSFLREGKWNVLAGAGESILFKKGSASGFALNEVVVNPKIGNETGVNIGRKIDFLGYNIINEDLGKVRVLHLTTYWRKTGEINGALGFFILGLNPDDSPAFSAVHTLGYRIYPISEWPNGQVVEENIFILVPLGLPSGKYRLRVGLFDPQVSAFLPVSDKENIDAPGLMDLKSVFIER